MIKSTASVGPVEFPSSPSVYYLWEFPEKPVSVRVSLDVVDRIEHDVLESFRAITARGSEVGGLLFGRSEAGSTIKTFIENYELFHCDYTRGPLYLLTDEEKARLEDVIRRKKAIAGQAGAVVGFFRSNTRKDLALDAEDLEIFREYFSLPEQAFLLVKPFAAKASMAGLFIWEDGKVRGEGSYIEFPFRRTELNKGDYAKSIVVDIPRPREGPAEPAAVASTGHKTGSRAPVLPFSLKRDEEPPVAAPPLKKEERASVVPLSQKLEAAPQAPDAPFPAARKTPVKPAPALPPLRDEKRAPWREEKQEGKKEAAQNVSAEPAKPAPVEPAAATAGPARSGAREAARATAAHVKPPALEAMGTVVPAKPPSQETVTATDVPAKSRAQESTATAMPAKPAAQKSTASAMPAKPPSQETATAAAVPARSRAQESTATAMPAKPAAQKSTVTDVPAKPRAQETATATDVPPRSRAQESTATAMPVKPPSQETVTATPAEPVAQEPAAETPAAASMPRFESLPARSPFSGMKLWALLGGLGMLALAGGTMFYLKSGSDAKTEVSSRASAGFQLKAERANGQLLVSWNSQSDAIQSARSAVLSISDGAKAEDVPLDLTQLHAGRIMYSPLSSDVSFKLEVKSGHAGKSRSESVRAPRATIPDPAAATSVTPPEPAPRTQQPSAQPKPAGEKARVETPTPAVEQSRAAVTPPKPFSLAARVRQSDPSDLPEAPSVNAAGNSGAIRPVVNTRLPALAPPPVQPPAAAASQPPPAAPAPVAAQPPVRMGGKVQDPRLLRRVDAVYPPVARQARVGGAVRLQATIGKDGKVKKVEVLSGPPLLRQAAVDAVQKWIYSPSLLNGAPVDSTTDVDVNFHMTAR